MSSVELSIIIPLYNAAGFVRKTFEAIDLWQARTQMQAEFIFVNDGSRDDTYDLAKKFAGAHEGRSIINFPQNLGKGCAVKEGMRVAKGDYVAFTDADLPYGLAIFDKMLMAAKSDPSLALLYGSRSHEQSSYEGYGFLRKLGRLFFSYFISWSVNIPVYDTQCGLKLMRADFARIAADKLTIPRFAFDVELFVIAREKGFKFFDFPVALIQQSQSSVRIFRDTFIMMANIIGIRLKQRRGFYA